MYLVIEDKDIQDLRDCISDYSEFDNLSDEELGKHVQNMGEIILGEVFQWGWNDTVVREHVCEYFLKEVLNTTFEEYYSK